MCILTNCTIYRFHPRLICLHKLLDDFFTRALCKEDFPGLPCAASLLPLNLPRDLEQNYASLADDRTLWDGIDNTNLFFFLLKVQEHLGPRLDFLIFSYSGYATKPSKVWL